MGSNQYPVIIIGGSIAAFGFIKALRTENDNRKILLISGEDRMPYKRTKINKNMVRGFDKEEFKLADKDWYDENNVELRMDRVINVNPDEKLVHTKSGSVISYDKLLLSTGAISATPAISGLKEKDIHRVQNAADVEALLAEAKDKKRFLIVGTGVEGIETADQLKRKGKTVTVAGRMQLPLQNLFPRVLSQTLKDKMESLGVNFFGGVSINAVSKSEDDSFEVKLKGQSHHFDLIVICAGTVPNIELGIKAQLKVERGIVVNEYLQTSDPDIYAAGDVAQHPNGAITSLWHAAEHQGQLAAKHILGQDEPNVMPPFRLKTDVFGLYLFSAEYDRIIPGQDELMEEKQGDIHRLLYFSENKLKAVLFINDGKRAKIYQQALFEKWDKATINKELPLPPAMTFSMF